MWVRVKLAILCLTVKRNDLNRFNYCSQYDGSKTVPRVLSARHDSRGDSNVLWQDRPIARSKTAPHVFDCSVKHEQCIRIVLLICEVIRAPVS